MGIKYVIIPLTHRKNGGFTELKVVGTYPSPPHAEERYGALNYPFVYRIFRRCAKGIVIIK
ncbi:MAG: hypothetical protein E7493_07550 [Ruminococcus albus]|nr:hypothetical protein [Ruminococcus albus]